MIVHSPCPRRLFCWPNDSFSGLVGHTGSIFDHSHPSLFLCQAREAPQLFPPTAFLPFRTRSCRRPSCRGLSEISSSLDVLGFSHLHHGRAEPAHECHTATPFCSASTGTVSIPVIFQYTISRRHSRCQFLKSLVGEGFLQDRSPWEDRISRGIQPIHRRKSLCEANL